jgi:hypothetical protein
MLVLVLVVVLLVLVVVLLLVLEVVSALQQLKSVILVERYLHSINMCR